MSRFAVARVVDAVVDTAVCVYVYTHNIASLLPVFLLFCLEHTSQGKTSNPRGGTSQLFFSRGQFLCGHIRHRAYKQAMVQNSLREGREIK